MDKNKQHKRIKLTKKTINIKTQINNTEIKNINVRIKIKIRTKIKKNQIE